MASRAGTGVKQETLEINSFPYTRRVPWRHGWAMWTQLEYTIPSLGSCRTLNFPQRSEAYSSHLLRRFQVTLTYDIDLVKWGREVDWG